MVQPDTVLRWHRRAFAWHWTRESRRHPGRPEVAGNIRDLIRRMSQANPLWGAPRIHGKLRKLGIAVAQSTVARSRHRRQPDQHRYNTTIRVGRSGGGASDPARSFGKPQAGDEVRGSPSVGQHGFEE